MTQFQPPKSAPHSVQRGRVHIFPTRRTPCSGASSIHAHIVVSHHTTADGAGTVDDSRIQVGIYSRVSVVFEDKSTIYGSHGHCGLNADCPVAAHMRQQWASSLGDLQGPSFRGRLHGGLVRFCPDLPKDFFPYPATPLTQGSLPSAIRRCCSLLGPASQAQPRTVA